MMYFNKTLSFRSSLRRWLFHVPCVAIVTGCGGSAHSGGGDDTSVGGTSNDGFAEETTRSSSAIAANAGACVPGPPGIDGWWPGDNDSPREATDVSGHHFDGSLIGGVAYTDGKVSRAFSFNGNAFVAAPVIPFLDSDIAALSV